MSEHCATINWRRGDSEFTDNQYSRAHTWTFDGGVRVAASASPDIVPLPLSVAENVDPEEAFVAALSSCHMLVFLAIAAKRRFVVDSYEDAAIGTLAADESGRLCVTDVTLRPRVEFAGSRQPSIDQLEKMHRKSHEQCFIANSVKTRVTTRIIKARE